MRSAGGFRRVVIIVIDGFGAGELPDAGEYGDEGSDTLDNLARAAGGVRLPTLESWGLGLVEGVDEVRKVDSPEGARGRLSEASNGKDTSTGHWEMAGVITSEPFRTFPGGFPAELLEEFSEATGYGWLGGGPASGTEIIKELGDEHIRSGRLIVYTSADSVFQIAAHEEVVPVDELYRVCSLARRLLDGYNVNRVIARPFAGHSGSFRRTERRKDFSVEPPSPTLLDMLKERGVEVVGVGKIGDIFVHRGLTREVKTASDDEGVERTIEALDETRGRRALVFVNLVDFDMLYGHRNDPEGSAGALERIDSRLPEITSRLTGSDLLILTSDHGCDPTTPSTDHSREYAPLLVWGSGIRKGVDLGTRRTFADVGATAAEAFGLDWSGMPGRSFLQELLPG